MSLRRTAAQDVVFVGLLRVASLENLVKTSLRCLQSEKLQHTTSWPCWHGVVFESDLLTTIPFPFFLFSVDDRGAAMPSPSPGRQEAGAPCTGEPLFLGLLLFLPLSSYPSLCKLFSLKWARNDVWCPKRPDLCWLREIRSAVGDFAFSWRSPDPPINTHSTTSHTPVCSCRPCPDLISMQSLVTRVILICLQPLTS